MGRVPGALFQGGPFHVRSVNGTEGRMVLLVRDRQEGQHIHGLPRDCAART
jgi:hypothetical protein